MGGFAKSFNENRPSARLQEAQSLGSQANAQTKLCSVNAASLVEAGSEQHRAS